MNNFFGGFYIFVNFVDVCVKVLLKYESLIEGDNSII